MGSIGKTSTLLSTTVNNSRDRADNSATIHLAAETLRTLHTVQDSGEHLLPVLSTVDQSRSRSRRQKQKRESYPRWSVFGTGASESWTLTFPDGL